ncbi:hypothetical protein FACS1894219_01690 [Clostridia bacterium]|nr:hypothetical protein FACS1894219_01690 [Clostridia bacterium]
MKKAKYLSLVLAITMIVSLFASIGATGATPKIGDKIGNVLNSDIKTYIDGNRIPSYVANNKTAIVAEELARYGFDVKWDNASRTLKLTRNPLKPFDPIQIFSDTTQKNGTIAFPYVYTDIVTYVGGKRVDSFAINGRTVIFTDILSDYGTTVWNGTRRESKFTFTPSTIAVSGITVSNAAVTLKAGETKKLSAYITPANASNQSVTWASSNSNVATVDGIGNVTAKAKGTASITAKSNNGKTAVCAVTVTETIVPTALTLNTYTLTLNAGQSAYLTATITPTNAENKTVTWTSSNTNVATVSSTGVVTAQNINGYATITATTSNGLTKNVAVNVLQSVLPTGITLYPTALTLEIGQISPVTATLTPNNVTDKTVTWTSSNPNIASVSNIGAVSAISAGTATITATTVNGLTKSINVTVNPKISFTTPVIGREYGSLVITDMSVPTSPRISNIQSFIFNKIERFSVGYQATITVKGYSNYNQVSVWMYFYNSNNQLINKERFYVSVTPNQYFDITGIVTIGNAATLDTAVRVDFYSDSGLIANGTVPPNQTFAVPRLNTNYGPFVLSSVSTSGNNMPTFTTHTLSSLVFTRVEPTGVDKQKLTININGTSTDSNLIFYIKFYNAAGTLIESIPVWTPVTANSPYYGLTAYAEVPTSTLNNAASIKFFSINDIEATLGTSLLPATPGAGTIAYYAEFQSVPDFGIYSGVTRSSGTQSGGVYNYYYTLSGSDTNKPFAYFNLLSSSSQGFTLYNFDSATQTVTLTKGNIQVRFSLSWSSFYVVTVSTI